VLVVAPVERYTADHAYLSASSNGTLDAFLLLPRGAFWTLIRQLDREVTE
jgi:hypothetical protein